jgi:hypothetical protein
VTLLLILQALGFALAVVSVAAVIGIAVDAVLRRWLRH